MFTRVKRPRPGVAIAVAALLLGAACGSSNAGTTKASPSATGATASSSSAPDLSGVTLTIGDQANGLKTLLTAAGTLAGTPYTVKYAEFQGAAPLFQAMQGGTIDTGVAADLPSLQAISGGLKIKLVAATTSNGTGTAILAQPESTVRSVTDLKGQTVVVSSASGSIAQYLLARALTNAGLKYSDVKVQFVLPTAAEAAFSTKKIQLWATFGIYQDIAVAKGARIVVDGADGRTSGVGFISAADASLADPAKKAAIADFLQRLAKAETWSATHASAYAKVFTQQNGVPAAVATVVVSQGATALLPVSPAIVARVQPVSDLMHQIGSLPTDVQVATAVDTSAYSGPAAGSSPAAG